MTTPGAATLRFRQRHLHQTLARFIEQALADLGWVNDPVNFGTTPATFMEVTPDEAVTQVAQNTVAITIGDEPEDDLEELGGAMWSTAYPLFVDIFGASQGISVSIANDVKDTLRRQQYLDLLDFTLADANTPPTPVAGAYIEFQHVIGPERPQASTAATPDNFRRYWRVVKATAACYFNE